MWAEVNSIHEADRAMLCIAGNLGNLSRLGLPHRRPSPMTAPSAG